jgi:hypothetical protein
MPRNRVRFEVTGLDAWIDGLERLDRPSAAAEAGWLLSTEEFYGHTQEVVHVDTGALKASGRLSVDRDRHTITGEVAYGGTPACDYAVYEFARGGSHDALTRGFVAAEPEFRAALGRIIEHEVRSWR